MSGEKILPQLISWPEKTEYSQTAEGSAQRLGFPRVIGAIDDTYVPITGRSEYRDSYICRKGFQAIHLQMCVTATLYFCMFFQFTLECYMILECSETVP